MNDTKLLPSNKNQQISTFTQASYNLNSKTFSLFAIKLEIEED